MKIPWIRPRPCLARVKTIQGQRERTESRLRLMIKPREVVLTTGPTGVFAAANEPYPWQCGNYNPASALGDT